MHNLLIRFSLHLSLPTSLFVLYSAVRVLAAHNRNSICDPLIAHPTPFSKLAPTHTHTHEFQPRNKILYSRHIGMLLEGNRDLPNVRSCLVSSANRSA